VLRRRFKSRDKGAMRSEESTMDLRTFVNEIIQYIVFDTKDAEEALAETGARANPVLSIRQQDDVTRDGRRVQ